MSKVTPGSEFTCNVNCERHFGGFDRLHIMCFYCNSAFKYYEAHVRRTFERGGCYYPADYSVWVLVVSTLPFV